MEIVLLSPGLWKEFKYWNMSPRIKICKETDCNDQATTKGYCRFHYLKNWNRTRKSKKKAVRELNTYVEGIMRRFPADFMNEISKDIKGWQDGSFLEPSDDIFEDFSSEDNIDNLLDNLKVDEEY